MAIGIIVGILMVVATFGLVVWALWENDEGDATRAMIATILAVVMGLGFLIVPFSFHTVDTGEVAVVKHLGEAKYVRGAGTSFDLWFLNKYSYYDTKVQDVPITTAAYSSDAQTMNIEMTLQYQILPDKALDIAKQYGSLKALDTRIQSIAIEKTKAVLSSHKAMDIIAKRASMSPNVEDAIRSAIGEEYYVNVVAVVLTNIDFSDAFESAVEDKMIAEQKQLKAEYENQTKIAKAEADAKAKVLAAEGEAEANRLLENSLNTRILQKAYIEKWDGKMPTVVTDGSTGMMLPAIQ